MNYLPGNYYNIFWYAYDTDEYIPLQGWNRLEFHQRVSAPWNHIIEFNNNLANDMIQYIRAFIKPDYIIVVYRDGQKVYEGVHNTMVDQSDQKGDIKLTLYGSGFTSFLSRRVIIPPTGQENDSKSGVAETVMKDYVNDHMVNPTDSWRAFPGLSIVTDQGRGEPVEQTPRYTNLMTVIQTLSAEGEVEFGIEEGAGGIGTFQFDAKPVWGLDRRINRVGSFVPYGDPMFFNFNAGNMEIPILSLNYSEEKNVVYVGGEGSGTNRTILKISTTESTRSPYALKEAFIDARRETTGDGLLSSGLDYLYENLPDLNLTFNLRNVDGSEWNTNWSLGDLVTGKYYDFIQNFKIREVWVTVTAGEGAVQTENINIELDGFNVLELDYWSEYTSVYYDPSPTPATPTSGLLGTVPLSDVMAVFSLNRINRTNNFNDGNSAVWSNDISFANVDTFYDFVVDAYTPGYIEGSGGTDINGWAIAKNTSNEYVIYKVSDVFGVSPSLTEQKNFGTDVASISMQFGWGVENWGICVIDVPDATNKYFDKKVYYTTDGETWTGPVSVGTTYYTAFAQTTRPASGIWMSSRTAGYAMITAYDGDGNYGYSDRVNVFKTTDYGATWTNEDTLFWDPDAVVNRRDAAIEIAYADENEETTYSGIFVDESGSDKGYFWQYVSGVGDLVFVESGYCDYRVVDQARWKLASHPTNASMLLCVMESYSCTSGGIGNTIAFFSSDNGDTWTSIHPSAVGIAFAGVGDNLISWTDNAIRTYTHSPIALADTHTGNLPGDSEIVAIVGGPTHA